MAGILATSLVMGTKAGVGARFPGPMVRHREAAAIAITYLHYGRWLGYASYKTVNKRLNDLGLSIDSRVWQKFGGGMLDLMQRPDVIDAAISGALDIAVPDAEGLYFIDNDEKGMSLFYIFCFALFGYKIAGFFYGYLVLLTASTLFYCWAFFRRSEILFLGISILAAHHAAMLVCQQLQPGIDVYVVHSSRFIGLISILASLHLSLLAATRERMTAGTLIPAVCQTILLSLIFICRNSAIWEIFPVLLITGILWMLQLRDRAWRPVLWPAGLALLAVSALPVHNALFLHQHYKDPQMAQGHIFWHQVAISLHNNPNRAKYGIPSTVQPWEDTVAQIVFAQEIARRGQTWADFETKDADRKLLNGIDLDWGAYERVLRDALLRTIQDDPLYALQSFLVYKPVAIMKALFSPVLFDWGRILDWRILIAVAIGALAAAHAIRQSSGAALFTLGLTFLASLSPLALVAPTASVVVEVYVVLLACGIFLAVVLLAIFWPARLSLPD